MAGITGISRGGSGGARGFLRGESTSSIDSGCGGVTGMSESGAVALTTGLSCNEYLFCCSTDEPSDRLLLSNEEFSDGLLECSTISTDLF
jgi:hypothetical protein